MCPCTTILVIEHNSFDILAYIHYLACESKAGHKICLNERMLKKFNIKKNGYSICYIIFKAKGFFKVFKHHQSQDFCILLK